MEIVFLLRRFFPCLNFSPSHTTAILGVTHAPSVLSAVTMRHTVVIGVSLLAASVMMMLGGDPFCMALMDCKQFTGFIDVETASEGDGVMRVAACRIVDSQITLRFGASVSSLVVDLDRLTLEGRSGISIVAYAGVVAGPVSVTLRRSWVNISSAGNFLSWEVATKMPSNLTLTVVDSDVSVFGIGASSASAFCALGRSDTGTVIQFQSRVWNSRVAAVSGGDGCVAGVAGTMTLGARINLGASNSTLHVDAQGGATALGVLLSAAATLDTVSIDVSSGSVISALSSTGSATSAAVVSVAATVTVFRLRLAATSSHLSATTTPKSSFGCASSLGVCVSADKVSAAITDVQIAAVESSVDSVSNAAASSMGIALRAQTPVDLTVKAVIVTATAGSTMAASGAQAASCLGFATFTNSNANTVTAHNVTILISDAVRAVATSRYSAATLGIAMLSSRSGQLVLTNATLSADAGCLLAATSLAGSSCALGISMLSGTQDVQLTITNVFMLARQSQLTVTSQGSTAAALGVATTAQGTCLVSATNASFVALPGSIASVTIVSYAAATLGIVMWSSHGVTVSVVQSWFIASNATASSAAKELCATLGIAMIGGQNAASTIAEVAFVSQRQSTIAVGTVTGLSALLAIAAHPGVSKAPRNVNIVATDSTLSVAARDCTKDCAVASFVPGGMAVTDAMDGSSVTLCNCVMNGSAMNGGAASFGPNGPLPLATVASFKLLLLGVTVTMNQTSPCLTTAPNHHAAAAADPSPTTGVSASLVVALSSFKGCSRTGWAGVQRSGSGFRKRCRGGRSRR